MKRTVIVFSVLLSASLIIMGCSRNKASDNEASDTQKTITIGFSNWSRSFEFYVDMETGMQEKAKELGVNVLLQDPSGNLAEQTKQLENFISRDVDGIIIVPIDSQAAGDEVVMVNDTNIPIITLDIAVTGGGTTLSHIASNNYLGGQLAAEFIGESLGGQGNVAVINNPTITSLISREKGFTDTIAEKYPNISIVSTQSGESSREKAMEVTENILQRETSLDAIFAVNDMMALGTLQVVQAQNRSTIIVGFDASAEACTAIKEGTPMKASIAQMPKLLGATGVQVMYDILQGKTPDPIIEVDVETVSSANVAAYIK
jgi:ribose transport system substrate-binding protein